MKKAKTNLKRISICMVVFSTALCWTAYAGELEPVYKQTLPYWWEHEAEHRNSNPEMLDHYSGDPSSNQEGPDGQVDSWDFFSLSGGTCGYGYLAPEEVIIQVSEEPSSLGELFNLVPNNPHETKFKEFAFRLRFKTQDSFCPDTGTALASFKVEINFVSPDPAENTSIDGFADSKEYWIFEEGQIYWETYKDGTYYEVVICDRIEWQPESERICLIYRSSGNYPWPHSLIIDTFDFRTKCFEPLEAECFSDATCTGEIITGIDNCEFRCDPAASQCSIVGSIDGEEFGLEDDCTFVATFGYEQVPDSTSYTLTEGWGSFSDLTDAARCEFRIPRIDFCSTEPDNTLLLIDCIKLEATSVVSESVFFTVLIETDAWPYFTFVVPVTLDEVLQTTEPYTCQDAFSGVLSLANRLPTDKPPTTFTEDFDSYTGTPDLRQSWLPGGNSPDTTIQLLVNPDGSQSMKISALICYLTPFWAWTTYTFPDPLDFSSLIPDGLVTVVGSAGNSWNTPTKVYLELTDTQQNTAKVCTNGNWTNTSTMTHELPLNQFDNGNVDLTKTKKVTIGLEADLASGPSEVIIDSIEISSPAETETGCEKECNILDEMVEGFNDLGLDFGGEYIEKMIRVEGGDTIYEQMPSTIECQKSGTPQIPLEVEIRISEDFEILPNGYEAARRGDKCGIQQQGAHYLIFMTIYNYCNPNDCECYCRADVRMTKTENNQVLMGHSSKYKKCNDFNEIVTKFLTDFQKSPNGHIPPFEFKNEDPKWKCPDER